MENEYRYLEDGSEQQMDSQEKWEQDFGAAEDANMASFPDFGEEDCEYDPCMEDPGEYDDSMDGDFDSAMASAGFGTDEDYGYYDGGDEY